MKRQKKAFALLAAILMMASLLSIGVGAEGTAEREEELRSTTYVAAANTYIYSSQGGTGTTTSVTKRQRVSSSRSWSTWKSIVNSSGDHWPDATRSGVSGYMWDRKICPKQYCYKVFNVSSYIYNSASDTSGYKYSFSFPVGTIMFSDQVDNVFNPSYRYVYMLYNSSVYTGWMLIGQTASESGTA